MKEHSFGFDATIDVTVGASVTETEYEDFSKDGETIEEYARRKAMEDASRELTMRIADNGVSDNSITIGDVNYHDEWES